MYLIAHEDVPCWYELGWDALAIALVIRIRKECCHLLPALDTDHRIISPYFTDKRFKSFQGNVEQGFGFNGAFTCKHVDQEWATLEGKIPTLVRGVQPCPKCSGTLRTASRAARGDCHTCDGNGRIYDIDWRAAFTFSTSCALLFEMLLPLYEGSTAKGRPQLLTLQCMAEERMHGGSLWGFVSKALALWGKASGRDEVLEVTTAMRAAMQQLVQGHAINEVDSTYCRIEGGNVYAQCPGDATEIHPENGFISEVSEGYKLACHNVDGAWQQLTFLAGLGALCDLARSEMKT